MALNQPTRKILVLPGGGATGVTTIRVLEVLEERLGRPIYQLFDEIWAASVGAMMAGYLTEPGVNAGQARSAKQVGAILRESFAHPWAAWHCLDRLQNEISPKVSLSDTLIPLKILTAQVKNFPKRKSPIFGKFETLAVSLDREKTGHLTLIEAVRASCSVYPVIRAQPLVLDPLYKETSFCIDSGCRVCTSPTLDPTQVFFKDGLSEKGSIQIYFISNGWTRCKLTSAGQLEVMNFDLDLWPQFQRLGSSRLGQIICANLYGMGFGSVQFLDNFAQEAIAGRNSEILRVMVQSLQDSPLS